jgi:hypothetical protein
MPPATDYVYPNGWKESTARADLHDYVLTSLPTVVKNAVKEVTKVSRVYVDGTDRTGLQTSNDKIWLLSMGELGYTAANTSMGVVGGDGEKYAGLSMSTLKNLPEMDSSGFITRSATYNTQGRMAKVDKSGNISYLTCNGNGNAAKFGFCI